MTTLRHKANDVADSPMTRKTRPVSWIRAALKEFETFPEGTQSICLAALTIAAEGGKADIAEQRTTGRSAKTGTNCFARGFQLDRGPACRSIAQKLGVPVIIVVDAYRQRCTETPAEEP